MRALYGGLPPIEAYPPEQRQAIEEERAREAASPRSRRGACPARDRA